MVGALLAQVHQDAAALLQLHDLMEALQQAKLRPHAARRQLPPPAPPRSTAHASATCVACCRLRARKAILQGWHLHRLETREGQLLETGVWTACAVLEDSRRGCGATDRTDESSPRETSTQHHVNPTSQVYAG